MESPGQTHEANRKIGVIGSQSIQRSNRSKSLQNTIALCPELGPGCFTIPIDGPWKPQDGPLPWAIARYRQSLLVLRKGSGQ